MSGRTPSFIVVGLVIIMFLLGLFYMSCSSKNTELRMSLEQYEERIRLLTIKNSDADKKLENIISRKRELDEEKLTIQRQMEKKDSEINDLNTKLNEKSAEIQTLKTDKNVLNEQLKQYKSVDESIATKDSLIEKLKQQLNDEKQSKTDEFNRLKQEYDSLKVSQPSSSNQSFSNKSTLNNFIIPQQRFRPFILNDSTTRSLASLFREPMNKLNNLTQEVKPRMVQAVLEIQDKALNMGDVNAYTSTTTSRNEQQQQQQQQQQQNAFTDKVDDKPGQNVPAPPLDDNLQRKSVQVESAQAAPRSANRFNQENQAVEDNAQYQQRLQRSLNNSISDNKNYKSNDNAENENDDEEQIEMPNAQQNAVVPSNVIKQDNVESNNAFINDPQAVKPNNINNNYRVAQRERFRQVRNQIQEEKQIENRKRNNDENNNNKEY